MLNELVAVPVATLGIVNAAIELEVTLGAELYCDV
jgi:hypothetical protein